MTLSDEHKVALNVRIAELRGFTYFLFPRNSLERLMARIDSQDWDIVPDFTGSLDAMHEVIMALIAISSASRIKFSDHLSRITWSQDKPWLTEFRYATASAQQLAEAFVRTLGGKLPWE